MDGMIETVAKAMINNITEVFNIIKYASQISYSEFEGWQKMILRYIDTLSRYNVPEHTIENFTDMLNMINDILFHKI